MYSKDNIDKNKTLKKIELEQYSFNSTSFTPVIIQDYSSVKRSKYFWNSFVMVQLRKG